MQMDDPYKRDRERAEMLFEISASSYEATYCKDIIEHFENGGTFSSYAEKIGVAPWILRTWQKKFPEFKDACLACTATPGYHLHKYNPMYCDMVIEWGKKGQSLQSFAGHISTTYSTVKHWMDNVPEFKEACEVAEMKAAEFWEGIGVMGATGKIKNFQSKVWSLVMTSRFKWVPAQDINKHEISGPGGTPVSMAVTPTVEIYIPSNGRDKPEEEGGEENGDNGDNGDNGE